MRIMNVAHRLALVVHDELIDVEAASRGRFSPDVQAVYDRWDDFRAWVASLDGCTGEALTTVDVGAPAPRPRQVFAIGLNYRDHAVEGGLELPPTPMVFTKFPASVTGPFGTIVLPQGSVDYEAELVIVIGRRAFRATEDEAWSYVAGLTVGQDLSERDLQLRPPAPQQFSLAKSHPGFAPMGPCLVTPDELDDPDDLEVGCLLNGEQMQIDRTSNMIFPVASIVAFLSSIVPLLPGDVIFSGTPSGVGWARDPQRFLQPADELVTYVEGVGEMRHRFTR